MAVSQSYWVTRVLCYRGRVPGPAKPPSSSFLSFCFSLSPFGLFLLHVGCCCDHVDQLCSRVPTFPPSRQSRVHEAQGVSQGRLGLTAVSRNPGSLADEPPLFPRQTLDAGSWWQPPSTWWGELVGNTLWIGTLCVSCDTRAKWPLECHLHPPLLPW